MVVESWPWFHIMDEAMQGRLYNSHLVLSPETAGGTAHHTDSQPSQNQENTDILEFLIKTEMDETAAAETAEGDGTGRSEAPPTAGVPMGWRRMTECSYKSGQNLQNRTRTPQTSNELEETFILKHFLFLFPVTEAETERMIKLRAANEALFTGRKHSAKPAWR